MQTYEGTNKKMETRAFDATSLGPNGNMQGGVRCFSLVSRRTLCRSWKDVTMHKMTENSIRRMNFMAKK